MRLRLSRRQFLSLLVILLPLFAGCASSKAYVTTRRDPHFEFNQTNKIAVASHAQPRPEEQVLHQAVQTELVRQGFLVVPPERADFTLTYWIEDAWKPGKKVIDDAHEWALSPGPYFGGAPVAALPPLGLTPGYSYTTRSAYTGVAHIVDAPFSTQGIRLKLFPVHATGANRLRPAWEGYIEGGTTVRARREAVLLRTLFHYFGKDFTGRAPLAD